MPFASYEIARMILDEADERFAPLFRPVPVRVDIFRQYCSVLDRMIETLNGESFEIQVDEETMEVHITLCIEKLPELSLRREESRLYRELIRRASAFRITKDGEERLLLQFTFPSLWDRPESINDER